MTNVSCPRCGESKELHKETMDEEYDKFYARHMGNLQTPEHRELENPLSGQGGLTE